VIFSSLNTFTLYVVSQEYVYFKNVLSFQDCDTYVRSLALRTMGVFCLLDQDLAKKYILVFYFQVRRHWQFRVAVLSQIFPLLHA
jgi:hypothetical protein